MENILYPNHPLRSIICRQSNSGKSVFLTNLISNFSIQYDKTYIYSLSPHQDKHQKIFKCFSNYKPINIIPNILNEEDIDIVIEEIVNDKDVEKSDTDIETYDSIEELKNPQEYDVGIIILDVLNEQKMNDPRVQTMFKGSRHINLSTFINSEDYYELPKRTIRANGNIYHIFKPYNFRDLQHLFPDKSSMDMNLKEYKKLTSACWDEKYQPLIIDMTKDK